jgi:hypothetical protein
MGSNYVNPIEYFLDKIDQLLDSLIRVELIYYLYIFNFCI